jgi:type IV pilus assembly protein PilB
VAVGASDIHFEPLEQTYRVRYRMDGILQEFKTFDRVFVSPFSAALKVLAGMDIAETRAPQDGAIHRVITGRKIDFRVATYPTDNGEKIVLRILDSNKEWIAVSALGLPENEKKKLIGIIEKPQGLVLCAGPTGSGKTSTLYAILKHLNNAKVNILTIEDPVEYRITGVVQAQVNTKKGFSFATGLRSMLRLDPNIILVGEMRDRETAEIGVQAALTGHLVLSSVHANSATQTVLRLIDMGVEKYVVGSSLNGVISQRLVRKICEKCKEPYAPTAEDLSRIGHEGASPKALFRGRGCHYCRQEGARGRIPIMEVLVIHNDMRPAISRKADSGELFQSARKHGMRTIQEDARDKVLQGLVTVEEMCRVLGSAT